MGQKLTYDELNLHRGDFLRKKYTWFNHTTGGAVERNVVCDITIETRGTYRGIVLYGWMMGEGNNTALLQHEKVEFTLGIDFNASPTYRGWKESTLTYSSLQIWEHNTDDLTWRICMNHTNASQSISMEFQEMPLAYWESINRGIKMHDPHVIADVSNYTLRYTL